LVNGAAGLGTIGEKLLFEIQQPFISEWVTRVVLLFLMHCGGKKQTKHCPPLPLS